MTRLEAINYLIDNDISYNEWTEAGMWNAVFNVMKCVDEDKLDIEYLEKLLQLALNN